MLIEREVSEVYAAAQASMETGATLGEIIEETMGLRPMLVPRLNVDAITVRRRRRGRSVWRIAVRFGVEKPQARYLAAGQHAAWWLRRYGAIPATPQNVARLAASVLAPAPLFRAVADDLGADVEALADAFCIPEPLVLLRLGEVLGTPVALHSADHRLVMIRGRGGHRARAKTIRFRNDCRLGRVYG